MKKTLSIIGKILASIFVIPLGMIGGVLYGLIVLLACVFCLPIAILVNIWDE